IIMVIRRTISRRKEKRLRSTEQPLSRKEPIVTSDHLDALPNVIDVENKHDLIDEKPTIFQELGGPHGLISALQMLSNAHLLTLVLCRQLHCGKYQDAYYLLTGILGCVGGFFLADTTDELQFRGVGKWAMRLQLLLIITACVDCIEIQCKECLSLFFLKITLFNSRKCLI
ncbi:hypothetical protein PENTCL1PPCAC_29320, partial [Pristionchus entomophagus]